MIIAEKHLANLKTKGHLLLNLLFPAYCPFCDTEVGEAGNICATCWNNLNFIADPKCNQCGFPFDHAQGQGALCAACLVNPPAFDKAIAVLEYDDQSKPLILEFKHGDRTDRACSFASWMHRAAETSLPSNAVIIPVPLHPFRLVKRRYNQAALLARELSRVGVGTFVPNLLIRKKHTSSQGGKSPRARHLNVQGAFNIHPKWKAKLKNTHVVLIDDVYTTGATVNACAKALKKNGARSVTVLTLSRVVKPVTISM